MIQLENTTPTMRRQLFKLNQVEEETESLRPVAEMFADSFLNLTIQKDFNLIKNERSLDSISYDNKSEPYSNLLSYIGESPSGIKDMETRKRRKVVDEKMEKFSNLFCDVWDQGPVKFDVDLVNNKISILVVDESGKEQYIEQRSQGFRYFLTFFIRLLANSGDGALSNQMILLDDPGLHLHPDRKSDLLDAMENLAENNQIIYTTHSPYMIDSSHLERIRVVNSKDSHQGTKISSDFSKIGEDGDSLKPVRDSLGATMSTSMITSGRSILVEGYTDRLYLSKMIDVIEFDDKEVSIANHSFLDMGGEGKWRKYAGFLQSEGYKYALLLDGDRAKEDFENKVKDTNCISQEQAVFVDEVIETADGDVEIEDLLGEEMISIIISDIYDVDESDFEIGNEDSQTMIDQAKGVVGSEYPDKDDTPVDKSEVAERFTELEKEKITEKCKENFSNLFSRIEESVSE
jgi:predicted ATP-dependent endonuclease of OLD family